MELFSQRDGPGQRTACINLCRGAHERGIPGAGIEIYEYRKSFLHAKVAVIDGHWATVGSSNIDPFSLLLSREANVVVDDEEFGATLMHSLRRAMESGGLRILRDNWKHQPVWLRLMSWLSYCLLRLMMAISGYAREDSRTGNDRTPAPE